jgi:hypothetical protein
MAVRTPLATTCAAASEEILAAVLCSGIKLACGKTLGILRHHHNQIISPAPQNPSPVAVA